MNCASFLEEKVFNRYAKLSKTKMQTAHYKQFAIFINTQKLSKKKKLSTG